MATTTGSGSAINSREARRRRIAERGSDRLALITGRIQTLPSPSSPLGTERVSEDDPTLSDFSADNDKGTSSLTSDLGSTAGPGKKHHYDSGSREGHTLHNLEMNVKASEAPREQATQVPETVGLQRSARDPGHQLECRSYQGRSLTLNEISSAIRSTEHTRHNCSLAAAVLVILSYMRFPLVGSFILKSAILLRPLYLLLLTNISIVLAQLTLYRQRGFRNNGQEIDRHSSLGAGGLANQVGNALELLLLLQNITNALFIDCSIYSVVIVFGLSVAQRLGW